MTRKRNPQSAIRNPQSGSTRRPWRLARRGWQPTAGLLLAGLLLATGVSVPGCRRGDKAEKVELTVYVGSSMRKPMERCIEQFTKETGITVLADYCDSGDVMTKVRHSGQGEAAVLHEPYIAKMDREGLATEWRVLANMVPAIVVRKGNPKGVKGLKDLTNANLTIGLTDARYATSGKIVLEALRNAGVHDEVIARVDTEDRSSGAMVNKVQIGNLDAATAWKSVAVGADNVDVIDIEAEFLPPTFEEEGLVYRNGRVPVGVVALKTSKHPEQTAQFVAFLASEKGRAIWQAAGFDTGPAVAAPARPSTQPDDTP